MSYILDALKKAERERQFAKIPTVNTVHRSSWDRRRPIWLWIAAAAVLANAALLIWLFRPDPGRAKETPPAPVASAPMTPALPEKPPAVVDRPAAVNQASKPVVTEPAPSTPSPSAERPVASDRPVVAPRQPRSEVPPETTPPKRVEAKGPDPVPGPPATASAPTKPKAAPAPVIPAAPSAMEKAATPSAPAATAPAAQTKPSTPPAPSVSEKPVAPPAPPRTAAAVPEKPAAPPTATAPAKPAERTGGSLPALQDMSAAEQEGMPKMALQVLVYSEVPAERMIFINNQKYVEGQSIEGKVAVESILPDGAILNYQGKRFKLRH